MENLTRLVIEEIALEGPYGIQWQQIVDRLGQLPQDSHLIYPSQTNLESVKSNLIARGTIERGRGDQWILVNTFQRYQVLGISALPIVFDNPQSLRILELVARGRELGSWSFHLCSAMNVDPKQLFHLSNILVDLALIRRFSSVAIPKRFKSLTSSTNASFFILTRYCTGSRMDPDICDVVDPAHSTDSVGSLILTLLREAGGIMLTKAVRGLVVADGGFTSKQYKRGKDKLVASRRIETTLIPRSSSEGDGDLEDDEEEKTGDDLKFVSALRLVNVHSENVEFPPVVKTEDPNPPFTPEESDEEEAALAGDSAMVARNLIRRSLPFKAAILFVIEAGGSAGVTSRELSEFTGVGTKEILKALETLRAGEESKIVAEWRNDGKRKFLVYRHISHVADLEICLDNEEHEESPPMSSTRAKGYVTSATVRRSTLAGQIVAERVALSLIDLGRAIEARELTDGLGVPGVQIDRRTLRKICEMGNIPVVEKSDFSATQLVKLLIAYDPEQISAAEAAQRVDRPLGLTPKADEGKNDILQKSQLPKTGGTFSKVQFAQVASQGRLAAIAVFGNRSIRESPADFSVAELYGFVRGADIFRARLLHESLANIFSSSDHPFTLSALLDELSLLDYLKVVGCGRTSAFLNAYFSEESSFETVGHLPVEVRAHLFSSVPGGGSPTAQLARALVPLVKLGVLRIHKLPASVEYEVISDEPAEAFWGDLYGKIFDHRPQNSSPVQPLLEAVPALARRNQWRAKMVVTLSQRRVLEGFLKRKLLEHPNPTTRIVVDGSDEDLHAVCRSAQLDCATALKALRHLYKLQLPEDARLVFAHVLQARFACPECGKLFFQLGSVQKHLQKVHQFAEAPADLSVFTRKEYMAAIDRLRSRKGMKKRRRRGRRVSLVGPNDREVVRAFALAQSLMGSSAAEEDPQLVLKVVKQILPPDRVVELEKFHLSKSLKNFKNRISIPTPNYLAVANLVLLNKLSESDLAVEVEKILCANKMHATTIAAAFQQLHADGLAAYHRRASRHFTISRNARIALFGKVGEISTISALLARDGLKVEKFVDAEPSEVLSFDVVDRMGDSGGLSSGDGWGGLISHEWEHDEADDEGDGKSESDINPDSHADGDDEGFVGIKRHLELTRQLGASIDRIVISPSNLTPNIQGRFVQQLLTLTQSTNSYLWTPSKREERMVDENLKKNSSPSSQFGVATAEDLLQALGLSVTVEEVRRSWVVDPDSYSDLKNLLQPDNVVLLYTVPTNSSPPNYSEFLATLFQSNLHFYYTFSKGTNLPQLRDFFGFPTLPSAVTLAAWMTIDGDVNEQCLADLLLHLISLVNSYPGIDVLAIAKLLKLLSTKEIEFLLALLVSLGLVGVRGSEYFVTPISSWTA